MSETTPPPGDPAVPAPGAPAAPKAPTPILSILSLVGGGLGVLLACCWGSGILFAIAGIVLGFLGRRREPNGKGLAIAGIICGFAAVLISIIAIIVGLVIGFSWIPFASSYNYY
ncbi:MAG: DUF4190 domain-containing protein [Actinomycetales bacterium]|nr:DUF4190 domain-containing protein [Actinomycetales bacterium]